MTGVGDVSRTEKCQIKIEKLKKNQPEQFD
jgi:hypothetical protein